MRALEITSSFTFSAQSEHTTLLLCDELTLWMFFDSDGVEGLCFNEDRFELPGTKGLVSPALLLPVTEVLPEVETLAAGVMPFGCLSETTV